MLQATGSNAQLFGVDTALSGLLWGLEYTGQGAENTEGEAMSDAQTHYGCLYCRAGSEERIINDLKNSHPVLDCISPKRVRIRRQGEEEVVTLFPGYILFKVSGKVDFRTIVNKNDIYRLLKYPTGGWELKGDDKDTAMMLFAMGGIVRLSKARFEESQVVMIDGPLKVFESRIKKINKRAKTANIEIEFQGRMLSVWLGFEVI